MINSTIEIKNNNLNSKSIISVITCYDNELSEDVISHGVNIETCETVILPSETLKYAISIKMVKNDRIHGLILC
jgi:hypothetical protein